MPDTSTIPLTSSGQFRVRRIKSNTLQVDIVGFNTSAKVYNLTNVLSYQAAAMGTNCVVVLYQREWYVC